RPQRPGAIRRGAPARQGPAVPVGTRDGAGGEGPALDLRAGRRVPVCPAPRRGDARLVRRHGAAHLPGAALRLLRRAAAAVATALAGGGLAQLAVPARALVPDRAAGRLRRALLALARAVRLLLRRRGHRPDRQPPFALLFWGCSRGGGQGGRAA